MRARWGEAQMRWYSTDVDGRLLPSPETDDARAQQ